MGAGNRRPLPSFPRQRVRSSGARLRARANALVGVAGGGEPTGSPSSVSARRGRRPDEKGLGELVTEKKEKKKSVTSETIDAARVAGQMFEDGDRTYVRFRMVDHYEVWPLQSVEARTWLAGVAHGVADAWVTASTLKGIADLLDGLVRVEGNKTPVHIRVARKGDAVYLDLGTDDWTCVKVTADGWEIIPHPEGGPYFYRPKRLQPLPTPKSGGHLEELLAPYIHVSETD